MKKSSFISGIIFGVIFIALGVFLFTLRGENTIILIIAIADLAFGLLLLLGGVIGSRKRSDDAPSAGSAFDRTQPAPVRDAAGAPSAPERVNAQPDNYGGDVGNIDFSAMSAEQIKAEEMRLRAESRRSAQEARDAVEDARRAVERAEQAERELPAAEALHYSQAAAEAKQKARSLRSRAQQIALLHSQAVDAAANLMDDDF